MFRKLGTSAEAVEVAINGCGWRTEAMAGQQSSERFKKVRIP